MKIGITETIVVLYWAIRFWIAAGLEEMYWWRK